MKEPKVSIVILTCNQKKLLGETLSSIINKTKYKNYKIIVVDNGSKNRHDLFVKKNFKKAEVIRNSRNLGFSKGNNLGIKKAIKKHNPDYFLLLNDDLEIIDKNWINKLISTAKKDKNGGIVGCKLIYPDGSFQDAGGYLKGWNLTQITKFKKGSILEADHFMGACILIKREVIDKIGMFDEIYSPFLLEDSDLFLRAKKAGYSVKVNTNVEIIHKKSKTVDAFTNSKHMFVRFKNDIIFSIRHLKIKNALFRIFIYLPLVAIFKKKKDQDDLKIKNFKLRKNFLSNIFLLLGAYLKDLFNLKKILKKRSNKQLR